MNGIVRFIFFFSFCNALTSAPFSCSEILSAYLPKGHYVYKYPNKITPDYIKELRFKKLKDIERIIRVRTKEYEVKGKFEVGSRSDVYLGIDKEGDRLVIIKESGDRDWLESFAYQKIFFEYYKENEINVVEVYDSERTFRESETGIRLGDYTKKKSDFERLVQGLVEVNMPEFLAEQSYSNFGEGLSKILDLKLVGRYVGEYVHGMTISELRETHQSRPDLISKVEIERMERSLLLLKNKMKAIHGEKAVRWFMTNHRNLFMYLQFNNSNSGSFKILWNIILNGDINEGNFIYDFDRSSWIVTDF